MSRAWKRQPGATFCVRLGAWMAYVQYARSVADQTQLIRVLPGLYEESPDLSSLCAGNTLQWIILDIKSLERQRAITFVGEYGLPGLVPSAMMQQRLRKSNSYHVFDLDTGKPMVVSLDDHEASTMPQFGLANFAYLKAELPSWNGIVISSETTPSPITSVLHFMYFPSKAKAERASQKIAVEVESSKIVQRLERRDSGQWSIIVTDENVPSSADRVGSILERICADVGGEYDGFEQSLLPTTL